MSMFCPNCHNLLMPVRRRGEVRRGCPRCSYIEGGAKGGGEVAPSDSRVGAGLSLPAGDGPRAGPSPSTPTGPCGVTGGENGDAALNTDGTKVSSRVHEGFPLFPFEEIRGGQSQFMEDVLSAIEIDGRLVACAPTGIGKTVAALVPAIQWVMGEGGEGEGAALVDTGRGTKGRKVFFLTPKQSQHRIAVDTVKAIGEKAGRPLRVVDVIAKQSMCPREFASEFSLAFSEFCRLEQKSKACGYHVRDNEGAKRLVKSNVYHVEELVETCTALGVCPHRTALDCMEDADVIVCDYNYIFSDMSRGILERTNIDLGDCVLIVDEAHNLPDRIRAHLSGELTVFRVRDASGESREINVRLSRHLADLADRLESELKDLVAGEEGYYDRDRLVLAAEEVMASAVDRPWTFAELVIETGSAAQSAAVNSVGRRGMALASLAEFLQGWSREYEGCVRIVTGGDPARLSYRLLDPSHISADVFRSARASVLMSGTLHPPSMYRDLLGMPLTGTILRSYASPFPKENRNVLLMDDVTTLYRQRGPEMYRRIARSIVEVSEVTPGNVASFFPSYAIMDSVASEVDRMGVSKEVLKEEREMNKRRREEAFKRLKGLGAWRGALLMGVQAGSFSEGMDYAGNLLSAVMVVGLPLAPPSLEVRSLQQYYSRKFGRDRGHEYGYIFPAMNKVLQAAGRGIRSERDRCVIVLMDRRFTESGYRRYIPEDFGAKVTKDPARDSTAFWSAGR